MTKKGFSLVELIIAIGILSVILSATTTLFIIGIKNYESESLRNRMQKEINFTADDIGMQIKQASTVPANFDTYTRTANTLILGLPAIDEDEEFLYAGQDLVLDYYIYYLDAGKLYKKVIPDDSSARTEKEEAILEDVTQFDCTYSPATDTELVSCVIETSRAANKTTFTFQATKTARLRNYR